MIDSGFDSGFGIGCLIGGSCGIPVPNVSGDLAHAAANGVLDVFSSGLSDAATWMVGHVIDLIQSTTSVTLQDGWFPARYDAMRNVVTLVVLPVLLAATAGAALRQDFRRLGRIWGVGLPVAVLAGLAGIQIASWGMAATDQMCQVIIGGGSNQLAKGFSSILVSSLTTGDPPFVAIVISMLIIAGTILVWLELVVRAAAIYVAVFFMPLALVGYIWPATASMAKRAVELLVALILSKFVIVATLTLGLAAVQQGTPTDGAVAGGAILLIAGFAPFCLLRLAPVVETAAIAHLEGLSRRPLRAATTAATAAASGSSQVARLLSAGSSHGSSGGGSASPVAAQAVRQRLPDFPTSSSGQSTDDDG